MSNDTLAVTAHALVAEKKGILASDEGPDVLADRFSRIGVEPNAENGCAYREILFSTPDLEQDISGIILYDDMLRASASDGRRFVDLLGDKGIIAGINADGGPHPLAGHPDEFVTEGLDGLRRRLAQWAELGARFTKWRAAIRVGAGMPSRAAITANAEALARYAALSQEAGLVPAVEPDVMMTGDHDLATCAAASEAVWNATYAALRRQGVNIEGTILKTNMVLSGVDCPKQAMVEEAAEATVRSLRRCVPSAVPGIAFLSGGQTDLAATAHLNAMNQRDDHPWQLTFCYGRAILEPVLTAWQGGAENAPAAQAALRHRTQMNALARSGRYASDLERKAA
ncbi:MAG: class I fructose-bisphosphate aldolase [Alphaproteobacteria bacterium]